MESHGRTQEMNSVSSYEIQPVNGQTGQMRNNCGRNFNHFPGPKGTQRETEKPKETSTRTFVCLEGSGEAADEEFAQNF